jgi:hypothetical protein
MPPPNARRAALIVIFGGLLAGAAAGLARADDAEAPAAPTIYKWVDANGIAHYTTELSRVPRSVRGSVRALGGAEGSTESYATRDAGSAAPPPEAAPGEPLPEWDVGDAPAPAPAPTPAPSRERWAETDRPFDMPPDEAGETPAPAPAPTQTAAAEAPAGEPATSAADRESLRRDLDDRIAALEAEIASDENALKGFLAVPSPENPAEIAYDQSFREVAERLPKRLAELRSLQGERAQLEQP